MRLFDRIRGRAERPPDDRDGQQGRGRHRRDQLAADRQGGSAREATRSPAEERRGRGGRAGRKPREPWIRWYGAPRATVKERAEQPSRARRDPLDLASPETVAETQPETTWDGVAVRERRLTWRHFELDDDLPRARPRPPDAPPGRDGRRHCGALEEVLYRQWDEIAGPPPPEIVRAVDNLAALPETLKRKLAAELDGIYLGPGGVPDLDDLGHLRGVPLPSGRATWDICAGAYGDRKIVVGDRPSPTPDVMFHEIGHALDDIDGGPGAWQSDTPEFRALYARCRPHLVSDFHRQPGELGRREFFADAFAAIASRQRPALVDMLGGDTQAALQVMLYFYRRYEV